MCSNAGSTQQIRCPMAPGKIQTADDFADKQRKEREGSPYAAVKRAIEKIPKPTAFNRNERIDEINSLIDLLKKRKYESE